MVVGILPGAVLIALAHVLDRPVYEALSATKPQLTRMEEGAFYRMVWLVGSLWTWVLIALGFYLHDRTPPPLGPRPALGQRRDPGARAVAVAGSAIVGGLIAEVLKVVIGRERPTRLVDGVFQEQIYTFKPLFGALRDGSNLGMPSSHAAAAFAGAMAIAMVAPTLRGLALAMAALCALSRIIASAHTLSDVVVGAMVGMLAAVFVTQWATRHAGTEVVPAWAFGAASGRGGRG